MDDGDVCNVCDGTTFTINAGFYYCDTCGTQAAEKREVEDHAAEFVDAEDVRQNKHKIKDTKKKEDVELTTWEAYNYILYGFVNELINLGCKEDIMLTTLQLWAAYLRQHEVAFYGKEETVLPKFNFHFKPRDVRLVYNLPKKKRRRSRSSMSSQSSKNTFKSSRQRSMAYTRKRKSLAAMEYEEFRSSQKSDISSVSLNLSQRLSNETSHSEISDDFGGIKYSQRTKRKARSLMSSEHIKEHRNDITGKLRCHDRLKEDDSIGRPFVFALLWLALNQTGDDVQLGDIIRFTKESHIKYNDVSSFFPLNVKIAHSVNSFRRSSDEFQSHSGLRMKALHLAKTIGVRELRMPDLAKLCRRYVEELCLPPVIADFADKLIAFYPPKMKAQFNNNPSKAVPNYEGRAMAYILFILKLFFGLDNDREFQISGAAENINRKLTEIDEQQKHLFVWTEWVQFIEMRNVIVSQCHCPTAMHIDPHSEKRSDLYVDFLKKATEGSVSTDNYRKHQIENIRIIFEQVLKLHEAKDIENKPSISFPATLMPFSTYMTYIEANQSLKSIIHIPDYMATRHDNRDFLSYLKPKSIRTYFRHQNINLHIENLPCNPNVEFSDVSYVNKKRTAINVQFQFDVDEIDWLNKLRDELDAKTADEIMKKENQHDLIKHMVTLHLNRLKTKEENMEKLKRMEGKQGVLKPVRQQLSSVENCIKTRIDSDKLDTISDIFSMHSFQYFDELGKDIDFDAILSEPRRNLDEQDNIFNFEDENDSPSEMEPDLEDTDSIEFLLSNFEYWIALENIYFETNQTFSENMHKLPKSFQWLLKQCAMQLHMQPRDLYIELLAIEIQFRYVLKPIFKMTTSILYRKVKNPSMSARTWHAVKLLKRIW